jgi:hypothetical protein
VLIAACTVMAVPIGAQPAQAASAKTCVISSTDQEPGSGKPTYNLTLKEQGTNCGTATKVMNAFQACRSRASYECARKVLSKWKCSGRKLSSTSTEFYANVTCTAGPAKVTSGYEQFT